MQLSAGDKLGPYQILAPIGAGGMGEVYRANDPRLNRDVAIKICASQFSERFEREAKTIAALNHPHICQIYDIGPNYLVMELIEGIPLHGPLPFDQALRYAMEICDALDAAHRKSITHRDLKPANILVTVSGVKLLDFGLAKIGTAGALPGSDDTTQSMDLTEVGTVLGTAPYMSPEQTKGEPMDARSDIFSFGVVLYEMLSGRQAFSKNSAIETMAAIVRDEPAPLDSAATISAIVIRCLRKIPASRFQTMNEVRMALEQATKTTAAKTPSIAVLPFANMSADKENEYFSDGLAEEILNLLAKIPGLKVIARTSAFAFKGKEQDIRKIAETLNVGTIVEGSVRRAGNRIRVTAQLIEAENGSHLWAERYDRNLEDVFAIQDEIAQSIARALRVMLTEKEKRAIEKIHTTEVQAYDYYLRGLQFMHEFRRKSLDYARQMFSRAIVLDPNYARAYAGVADCCSFMFMYFGAIDADLKEADSASRRAIELDPESAEGHTSRGLALSLLKNFEEAEREFDIAIRSNPNLYEAYYFYGRACFAAGQTEQAALWSGEAMRVNPDDYNARMLRGLCYRAMGQIEKCVESRRETLRVIERHVALHPEDTRAIYLGANCFADIGQREMSLQWAERALAVDPEESAILYNVACNYALNHEPDKAMDCLEKAIRNGFGQKAWIENDPDFEIIRTHSRYQALLARI